MTIRRHGERVNARTLTLADGQEVEIWLKAGSTVEFHHRSDFGSGQAAWHGCREPDCVGADLGQGRCFEHLTAQERSHHIATLPAKKHLILNGVRIDANIWSFISKASTGGVHVSCVGAMFTSKLDANDRPFNGSLSLTGATLEAGLEIHRCAFSAGLHMNYVDFGNSPATFWDCTIEKDMDVAYSHTQQHLAFTRCTFKGGVRADGFAEDIRFDECTLLRSLSLTRAAPNYVSMEGTTIGHELNLDGTRAGNLRCPRLTLLGTTDLGSFSAEHSCDLSGSRFERRIQMSLSSAAVNLTDARFCQGGRLEAAGAAILLDRLTLDSPLTITGQRESWVVSMSGADAGSLTLSSLDMTECRLANAHDLASLSLESSTLLRRPPGFWRTRRKCLADEFAWRAANSRLRANAWRIETARRSRLPFRQPQQEVSTAASVAATYRAMRKSLEGQSNQPGAADFYYGEMEMRRVDRHASFSERSILTIYWLVSGYGLRALRSIAALVVTLFVGTVLLFNYGFTLDTDAMSAALTALESAVPGGRTEASLTDAGRAISLTLKIIGPVLVALAFLALRNRVKR